MNILIVEDEAKAARQLMDGLEAAGFKVKWAADGERGLELARSGEFDALVVDVMLPGRSGLELVRALRKLEVATPALFLSAKGEPEDRVRGLEEGGDDYLVKPYAFPEVLARLRAILRRVKRDEQPARIEVGDLIWEPELKRITRQNRRIDLTPKEYALAALLLEHIGEVVSRDQIMRVVWGLNIPGDGNAIDVQVRRLRAKLDDPFERKLIHTLRGMGITLEARD
jgi:two-component system, OmpR family, copper resistance phosphate regulon response regulator CusR